MAHNIDRAAFVKGEPWWLSSAPDRGHKVGDAEVTSQVMLEGAGLGWQVDLQDVFTQIDDTMTRIDGKRAVVRSDTGAIFQVVSDRWEPVQNTDAFAFFDSVVGEGAAVYHTAGSLGKGEKVWILAKLPKVSDIAGDIVEQYVLLANSHDGKTAFTFQTTPIRVVCENTLNFALGRVAGQGVYRKFHLSGVTSRLNADDAREIIGLAGSYVEEFEKVANQMAAAKMSSKDLDAFLAELFPVKALPAGTPTLALPAPDAKMIAQVPAITIKRREEVKDFIVAGAGNERKGIKGTKWAAINGVAEWTDFAQGKDANRAKSLLFGTGRTLKQRAFDLLAS